MKVKTERPPCIFLEGGKLVATDHTVIDARRKLQVFVAYALRQDTEHYSGYKERGAAYPSRL